MRISPRKIGVYPWCDRPLVWHQSRKGDAGLEYSEEMARLDMQVDESHIEYICCRFDNDGMIEVIGSIAFENMSGKFKCALGVPPQNFCRISRANLQSDFMAANNSINWVQLQKRRRLPVGAYFSPAPTIATFSDGDASIGRLTQRIPSRESQLWYGPEPASVLNDEHSQNDFSPKSPYRPYQEIMGEAKVRIS